VPETLILACARKALFRPTQFRELNLHIEFGKVNVGLGVGSNSESNPSKQTKQYP